MSSFKIAASLQKGAKAGFLCAVLGLPFAVAGCGFSPLYGQAGTQNAGVLAHLAAIDVSPIENRIGQKTRIYLTDAFTTKGAAEKSLYTLDVTLTKSVESQGIRRDETATRGRLSLRASYSLTEAESGAGLQSGNARATASFDILEDQFASKVAEADAEERAAKSIAEDIKTRLSLFFKNR